MQVFGSVQLLFWIAFGLWIVTGAYTVLLGFVIALWALKPKRQWTDCIGKVDMPEGKLVELKDGPTFYNLAGPEGAPVVVLLHGVSFFSFVWLPLQQCLIASGFRVLTFDFYGHGFSALPPKAHDVALLVSQTRALLEELGLHKLPITLVGHSMGGLIGTHYCARHGEHVAKLVLISPAGYPSTDTVPILNPFNWLGYWIGAALAVVKVPALGEAVTAIGTFCIQELIMRAPPSFKCLLRSLAEQDLSSAEPFFLIHLCAQIKFLYQTWAFQFMRAPRDRILLTIVRDFSDELLGFTRTKNGALFAEVGAHDRPVLVVWGTRDPIVPLSRCEGLQRVMPRATIERVPRGDHAVFLEHRDVVHTAILKFAQQPAADPLAVTVS